MQRPKQRTKFGITPEKDFRAKIRDVVEVSKCMRHAASEGEPCFNIPRDTGGYYFAICNRRASQVYKGEISEMSFKNRRNGSLSNKRKNAARYPKKEHA